jgi:hypothetical protein
MAYREQGCGKCWMFCSGCTEERAGRRLSEQLGGRLPHQALLPEEVAAHARTLVHPWASPSVTAARVEVAFLPWWEGLPSSGLRRRAAVDGMEWQDQTQHGFSIKLPSKNARS